MTITDSVKNQTQQIFQNIELIFNDLEPVLFSKRMGGFLVWKQVYHMIHSLDKNLMDPSGFVEPGFHEKNLDVIYLDEGTELSKEALYGYFLEVSGKTRAYLAGLDEGILAETVMFKNHPFSRMELLIAQIRHIFYHIGYLHCCIKIEKGRTPEYIGLYVRKPDD